MTWTDGTHGPKDPQLPIQRSSSLLFSTTCSVTTMLVLVVLQVRLPSNCLHVQKCKQKDSRTQGPIAPIPIGG